MKSLMLLNPRKGKKSRKKSGGGRRKAQARRKSTRRKATARKYTAPKRTMKAKARRSGRRRKSGGKRRAAARTYKASGPLRSVSLRVNPARRRGGRRRSGGGGLGNFKSMVKEVLSRETVAIGGGAVAGTLLTSGIVARYGTRLPGLSSTNDTVRKLSVLGYDILIPVTGALLTRRFAPRVAKGMLYAAAFNAITDAVKLFGGNFWQTAASGSYLPAVGGTNEYLDYAVAPVNGTPALPPGPSAMNMLAGVTPMNGLFDTTNPFPSRGI